MSEFHFGLPPWINYTIDSWTNIDASYPAANSKEYLNITKQTRTSDTTGSVCTIDLEAGYNDLIIGVDHTNFTAIHLEGDDEATFTTPPIDYSPTITYNKPTCWWEAGTLRRRYKYVWKISGTGIRYLRLTIANQTATNSAAYHFVGRIMITNNILSLSQPPDWDITYSPSVAFGTNERSTGDIQQYSTSSYKIMEVNMGWNVIDSSYESDIWTLDNIRPDQQILMWNNMYSDPADFYILQAQQGGIQMNWGGPYHRQFSAKTFREVVAND